MTAREEPVVVITVTTPAVPITLDPCALGSHRWAYLTTGGQACGYCGVRR